jgi:halocyanin-like protein
MGGQTRRDLLRGGVAASATALGVGAATTPTAAQGDDYGGWLSDVDNYDGTTEDLTGQDAVEIEVGAQGNGGTFAYAPPAVKVSPGTTVTFNWTSNTHNVLLEEQPGESEWEGHEPIENTGFTLEHTFEVEGVYKYYCEPHLSLGMKGVVVVESGGGGAEGVPAEYGDWFSDVDNFDGTTEDMTGQESVEVEVGAQGNGGTFAYAPPAVRVSPGTTVTFNWTSNTHNVLVEEQPDGASWEGYEPIENTGFTYEHTFETPGVYTYYCEPHLSLGMKGAVVVGPAPGGGAGGEAEASAGAIRLLQVTQGVLSVVFLAILGVVAYVAINRQRYPAAEPDIPDREPVAEAAYEEPQVEIEHDDFDPVGTFTVILGYFVILVLMWVFMYFVEFLGNGPTVVG